MNLRNKITKFQNKDEDKFIQKKINLLINLLITYIN